MRSLTRHESGREIFIESSDKNTGKPMVWYQFDRQGRKVRYERGPFGISTEHLGASEYL